MGSQWRTPQLGKSVVVSSWRGVTRIQRWPKKRGIPKDPDQANRLELFRWVQNLIKALHPIETLYEREAIKAHNRRNRGQRGSAAIRHRDWLTQRIYGRGIALTSDIDIVFYPPAVARDASFIMDHAGAVPGQFMQRSAEGWDGGTTGLPGQILTSNGPGNANTWETP